MFKKAVPESVGISSKNILKYLKVLNGCELSTHSVLIARGDSLVCEAYWQPFDKDTAHRMYSQTKSYVGLAVRLLAEDGLISLDEKIIKYFPEKLPEKVHPFLEKQTVRDMLMMRTCFDDKGINWFTSGTDDRVALYFHQTATVYPGTQYHYDSMGSFVLGALVEKMTGKTFLDYLREKCLDEIGFSKEAHCLKCPGGYSWADSALICTPRDMLAYGRLVGCMGLWEGRQIVPRRIFEEAFSDYTDNFTTGFRSFSHHGYISQFWKFCGNSVGFNGMHDQITFYDPDTDITVTCTSGNNRDDSTREILVSYIFTEIIDNAKAGALPEDDEAFAELEKYIADLKLVTVVGKKSAPLEAELGGRRFITDENKTGITEFTLEFDETGCNFKYINKQGAKVIRAGRCENVFEPFPEEGYSDEIGTYPCPGNYYKCAASFGWMSDNQLLFKVQIIDKYIGVLHIALAYRDGIMRLRFDGDAEAFLTEYNGVFNARIE